MNLRAADFKRAARSTINVSNQAAAIRDAYGRYCLALPHLVTANGLAQTVAYLLDEQQAANDSPAGESDARAAGLILDQIRSILGPTTDVALLNHARTSDNTRSLFDTSRLLAAWEHDRRLAESVLGATKGGDQ